MTDLDSLARSRNHFELFSLPIRFSIDRGVLESRYLDLARVAHPDLAGPDVAEQAQAVSLQARINDAYATLSDDLARARHILELAGIATESSRTSPETMHRVFELREALSLAQSAGDGQAASAIRGEARQWLGETMHEIGRRLDAGERTPAVAELIASAKYIERIATV